MTDNIDHDAPRRVLLESHRWTVVGSGAESDGEPLCEPMVGRRRWSRRNAHSHDAVELMLCVAGSGVFGLAGRLYAYEPGSLLLLLPGAEHDYNYPPATGPAEHLWMRFIGGRVMIAWLRIDKGSVVRKFTPCAVAGEAELGVSLDAFLAPLTQGAPPDRSAGARLLAGVIGRHLAARLAETPAPASAHDTSSLHREVVRAICRHIQDTAGRGVDLDGLAHLTGYSKFHLTRVFRREKGCTIHQYVDEVRLARIAALEAAGASNARIAAVLGFSCSTAYIRWRRRTRPQAPRALGRGRAAPKA